MSDVVENLRAHARSFNSVPEGLTGIVSSELAESVARLLEDVADEMDRLTSYEDAGAVSDDMVGSAANKMRSHARNFFTIESHGHALITYECAIDLGRKFDQLAGVIELWRLEVGEAKRDA